MKPDKRAVYLATAVLALAALSAKAADPTYSYWNGNYGDNWNTPENWNSGLPSEECYAQFGSPYETPYTIAVNDLVKAYAFYVSGSRTAGLTFTGTGAIETYRTSEFINPNGGSCLLTFDVAVTNASGSDQGVVGNSIFKKDLFIGTDHSLNIGNSSATPASVALTDNANLTSVSLNIYKDASLVASNTAALNLTGDSYLKVYKQNSFLGLYDDVTVNGKYLTVYSGASAVIADNAKVDLSRDLTVQRSGSLTVSGDPVINCRRLTLPFSTEDGVDDEWTMNGGMFCATNSNEYYLSLYHTNAVKTLSGKGTFHLYRFYTSHASNLVIRLNGPNAYLRQLAGGKDITLKVGNGSTLGAWGDNLSLYTSGIQTLIDGDATFDTTDYQDGVTGRTLTIGDLDACTGTLTVKGVGTAKFVPSKWNAAMPNVGITLRDSVKMNLGTNSNGEPNTIPIYSVGPFALKGSSSFDGYYIGHTENPVGEAASFTMEDNSYFTVARHLLVSGNVALSGNSLAVVRNESSTTTPFSCANLTIADGASLVVTGNVSATTVSLSGNASLAVTKQLVTDSLYISGNAHLAFMAGAAFTAGAAFGDGDWTMEITIPSGYEAGIRPIVKGAEFDDDFTNHVTIVGENAGWEVRVVDGMPVLNKPTSPSGIEWIGASTTGNDWSDTANWNNGTRPTADDFVAFGGLVRPEPFDDGYLTTVSGLVFRASAGPFCITGSVEKLTLAANAKGRSSSSADNAAIVSYSGFDQTVALPVVFPRNGYVLAAGGGTIDLPLGLTQNNDSEYLLVGGDVQVGGVCSVAHLSFISKHCNGVNPCLTLKPGCDFTVRCQGVRSFAEETSYSGSFVINEGAVMTVQDGDCCFFYPTREIVVDGTLIVKAKEDSGRLVATKNEQYYVGKGAIYADSARAGRNSGVTSHYINIGGTLKLYMNGNWWTATYYYADNIAYQNPNYPTRFRMTDGTTLGATQDWFHGPRTDAGKEAYTEDHPATITPADRTSIMVGTVTVDTLDPKDGTTAHTITFIDPLDASAANVVKVGAGTLAFNEPDGYPSQVSNLTVNAGTVQFGTTAPTIGGIVANAGTVRFAAAPTLSGTLTIASTDADFRVDGLAETAAWGLLATAADIVGPNNEEKWKTANGMRRFKIVAEGTGKSLYGAKASGFAVIVR